MTDFRVEVLSRKAPRARKRKARRLERIPGEHNRRSNFRSMAALLWWLVKPRRPVWVLGALAFVLVAYGTPHVLVTYRCSGVGTPGLRCTECRYFGVQGMRSHLGPNWDCPVIAMLPVNWSALRTQLENL